MIIAKDSCREGGFKAPWHDTIRSLWQFSTLSIPIFHSLLPFSNSKGYSTRAWLLWTCYALKNQPNSQITEALVDRVLQINLCVSEKPYELKRDHKMTFIYLTLIIQSCLDRKHWNAWIKGLQRAGRPIKRALKWPLGYPHTDWASSVVLFNPIFV